MKLKLSAVLLSSVLASVSYASDVSATSGSIAEQAASTQMEVFSKVVPDSFEGVGEFRARRAALESRLQSFQGQKLKVFTPEIFAGMLTEGIEIAQLGLGIFNTLPGFFSEINIGLLQLKERIDGINALISWEDLGRLAVDISKFDINPESEFLFDFSRYVQDLSLTKPVEAAHTYTMDHSEALKKIVHAISMARHASVKEFSEYSSGTYTVGNSLSKLVKLKFIEDDEDLLRFVSCVAECIQKDIGWDGKELHERLFSLNSDFYQSIVAMLEARLKQGKQSKNSRAAFNKRIVSEISGVSSEDLKSEWYYVYTSTTLRGDSKQEQDIKTSPEIITALHQYVFDSINKAFDQLPEFAMSGLPRVKN